MDSHVVGEPRDTPRTNAERFYRDCDQEHVHADFARQLERELALADAYIKALWKGNLLPRPMPEALRDRLSAQ